MMVLASRYIESLAVQDVWLNQVVGCDTASLTKWTCGLPCERVPTVARLVAFNKSEETLALTARQSAHECTLVFRGSKDVYNVLEDLTFFPKAVPGCHGCKVHSGFYNSWRSVEPQVREQLNRLGCENSTLSIVGHSLGAAMAAIAAYDLSESSGTSQRAPHTPAKRDAPSAQWSVGRVYTYGQPRVGNERFAAAFDARLAALGVTHFRVVEYRDAVPHLPPANMLWEGWAHTGEEVYYNATALGQFITCRLANDTHCSARWGLLQTLTHTCDHCSYLGMNPCDCGVTKPQCQEP